MIVKGYAFSGLDNRLVGNLASDESPEEVLRQLRLRHPTASSFRIETFGPPVSAVSCPKDGQMAHPSPQAQADPLKEVTTELRRLVVLMERATIQHTLLLEHALRSKA